MEDKNITNEKERIRTRILSLIDSEYESDASFERALGLKDKTVNNWRRSRSASYMKILPLISETLGVGVSELLDVPIRHDTSELSEDELRLLTQFRRARTMPKELRIALRETLENIIHLYMKSANELKSAARDKRKREIEKILSKTEAHEA